MGAEQRGSEEVANFWIFWKSCFVVCSGGANWGDVSGDGVSGDGGNFQTFSEIFRIFQNFPDFFRKSFLVTFGPFSGSPGAGASPGRSGGPPLRPGEAPAPGKPEKKPKVTKNDFRKNQENSESV